jgi:D-methionine transport system substrate-binding protein
MLTRRDLIALICGLALVPASATAQGDVAKKALRVGFVPGPYIDTFKAGVQPYLEKKGYTIQYFDFSTGLQANTAVDKGEIDANVMQHSVFLNAYNDRNETHLVGIVQVPTPPMGLYSKKHPRDVKVKAGMSVAVPNDPVNLERALKILRDLGWIELKPSANPIDVSELDVVKNPSRIRIVPLEAAQAPRALEDVDFAAIQGNFAIYSKLKLTDAIALEDMQPPYINVVAVNKANADTVWAKDIVAGYRSDDLKAVIKADRFYDGFALPDYLK